MSENAITMKVESKMGAMFIALFAAFLVGFLFIVLKNFNSDAIAMDSSQTQIKTMSSTERQLIANWLRDNNIDLPKGEGYRYIERKYPDKPWLKY
jgi:sensor domain CHASE-containing protein